MPNRSPSEVEIRAGRQIGIRLPARLHDQLTALAQHEHNGVSAVCIV